MLKNPENRFTAAVTKRKNKKSSTECQTARSVEDSQNGNQTQQSSGFMNETASTAHTRTHTQIYNRQDLTGSQK